MKKRKSSHDRFRLSTALVVAVFVGTAGLIATTFLFAESNFSQTGGRPFANNSAWNTAIPANPKIDPNSAAIVQPYTTGGQYGVAGMYAYGKPIYYANASTPKYSVNCTASWGTCGLEKQPVPIPANAKASPGSDGHLVVVDLASRKSYEFWQYSVVNGQHQTTWGGVVNIDGDGRDGSSIGAGVSVLAGIVRLADVNNGVIDHALVFSTSYCQGPDNGSNFRYPAAKTDGKYFGTNAIPEGGRIQLDPAVNVDAIPGITAGEKMVAKALQKYGAYAVDCGGAPMGIYFEDPKSEGVPDPYPAIGFTGDYYGMRKIPWNKIRLLDASVTQPAGTTPPAPTPPPPAPAPTPTPTPIPQPTPTPTPAPTADTQKPTPPTKVNIANITSNSATLNWAASTDNVGVAKYNVWRIGGGSNTWTQVTQTSPTTLSYTNKNLSPGDYTFAVRSMDAAGNISESSAFVAVTIKQPVIASSDTTPPTAPVNLVADKITTNSVSLNWGPSTDNVAVAKYNVWRTDRNSNTWKLLGSVSGATTSFVDTTVSSRSSYTYGIRAVDAAGNISNGSNVTQVVTPKSWYQFWWW